jgi:hypothetical protein
LAAIGIQGDGEVLAVLDPEVAVAPPLEVGGLALEGVGEGGVAPDQAGQAGAAQLGVIGVLATIGSAGLGAWSAEILHPAGVSRLH